MQGTYSPKLTIFLGISAYFLILRLIFSWITGGASQLDKFGPIRESDTDEQNTGREARRGDLGMFIHNTNNTNVYSKYKRTN